MSHILAGISWPFRIEDNGLPAPAKGTEVVRSALVMLMRTQKRSRVMRPTLGTALNSVLFENQGPILSALVQRQIASAISDFLPQVRIIDITIKEIDSVLAVNVQYSVQNVRDETGFVTISETGK